VPKAAHHRGAHQRRAKAVTDAAYADPTTTCRRCGLTLEQRQRTHPNDTWDAGHPDSDQVGYAPEHASCNRSAGATKGNRDRTFPTSRDW